MKKFTPFRIKCDSIAYRGGFLEVTPGIHDGCVNIEAWDIDADTSLTGVTWVDDPSIPDSSIKANTELELTAKQARNLAEALLAASELTERPMNATEPLNTKECDECGSMYFTSKSQMAKLCPHCAHHLYGYPNCDHDFVDGRCLNCHWDGSVSDYIRGLKDDKG